MYVNWVKTDWKCVFRDRKWQAISAICRQQWCHGNHSSTDSNDFLFAQDDANSHTAVSDELQGQNWVPQNLCGVVWRRSKIVESKYQLA